MKIALFSFKPNTDFKAFFDKFKCQHYASISKPKHIYYFKDCDLSLTFKDDSIIEGGKCIYHESVLH